MRKPLTHKHFWLLYPCMILWSFAVSATVNSTLTGSYYAGTQTRILKQRLWQQLSNTLQKGQNFDASQVMSMVMPPCASGPGVIGGVAYGDFNYNGLHDQIGQLPNVAVHLYGCGSGTNVGALIASTTTDALGNYSFSGLTDGVRYRLEFVAPSFLEYTDGFYGTANATSTAFAVAPSCDVNVGFANKEDVCQTNPSQLSTCFTNGDPLPAGSEAGIEPVLVGYKWNDSGNSLSPNKLGDAKILGSIYGIAWDRDLKVAYTSAFVKRHSGLGPLGLGGIYRINNLTATAAAVTPLIDLTTLGLNVGNLPSNSARGLPGLTAGPSNDPAAYAAVGKQGLGGMAFDNQNDLLYFINLQDKKLYSLHLPSTTGTPTASQLSTLSLPNPGCVGGEFRPFAVTVWRGKLYVGGVCDAFTSQSKTDLEAIIYRRDGSTFVEIERFKLDYSKGAASRANNCSNFAGWYPWKDTVPDACDSGTTRVYPQPILSEITFDIDGSMMLGFMDRAGHQLGYRNYPITGTDLLNNVSGGDLLRSSYTNGDYVLESNGSAGGVSTTGLGNAQGPGGGEFYWQDEFNGPSDNLIPAPHQEVAQGALSFFPGAGSVASTSLDPYSTLFNSGGVNYFSNTQGSVRNPGYVLYRSSASTNASFAKANGLGDIISLCEGVAPYEIGGYIWSDDNDNGIQDPCELPISNVNVALINAAGTVLSTVTTNASGRYNFNTNTPGLAALTQGTTYYMVAGWSGQFNPTTGRLNGNRFLTVENTGQAPRNDTNDSDATFAGNTIANGAITGYPHIAFTRQGPGQVEHNYGFGFTATNLNPIAGIGGAAWNDVNKDGIQASSEAGIPGVTVTLFNAANQSIGTQTTSATGEYFFANVAAGSYYLVFNQATHTSNLGQLVFSPNTHNVPAFNSDADPITGRTPTFAFAPIDGDLQDMDAGLYTQTGAIGGFVWNDTDQDGIQDAGEPGLQGATVVISSGGTTVATTTVAMDGTFNFPNLPSGNYIITVNGSSNTAGIPNLVFSPQDQGSNDAIDSDTNNSGVITLNNFNPANGNISNLGSGLFQATSLIEGTAWVDTNMNGLFQAGEIGASGVTVSLLSGSTTINTTTTNSNGDYAFTNVPYGTYTLQFNLATQTAGLNAPVFSPMNVGNNDNIDSDVSSSTGLTASFTTSAAQPSVDMDAGLMEATGTISGFAWLDNNQNGLQNAGELGVAGVTVTLFTASGTVVTTAITSNTGSYMFTGVIGGSYYVGFDFTTNAQNFNGLLVTQQDAGDDTIDSDIDPTNSQTDVFTFNPNSPPAAVSAGAYLPSGSLQGYVWHDVNTDGLQQTTETGIGGVNVNLVNASGTVVQTVTTAANGIFTFTNVMAGTFSAVFNPSNSTLGTPFVIWSAPNVGTDDTIDSDVTPSTNTISNIVFDPANGSVTSFGGGLSIVQQTIRGFVWEDSNYDGIQTAGESGISNVGVILFNASGTQVSQTSTDGGGLYTFSAVNPGNYYVVFDISTQGNPDYIGTTQNAGVGNNDSDADPTTGQTAVFAVNPTASGFMHIDAGFVLPALNGAIGNMIFKDCNKNGIFDAGEIGISGITVRLLGANGFVRTIVSDLDGHYMFNDVPEGDYQVAFVLPNIPQGLQLTVANVGTDDLLDSDANAQTGLTATFALAAGQVNNSIDAGYVDNERPIFINAPANTTASCSTFQPNTAPLLQATDNCDVNVEVTVTEVRLPNAGGTCAGGMRYERTWIATDDCGNEARHTQIVTVADNAAPTFNSFPADITIECTQNVPGATQVSASDDCDTDVTITSTEVVTGVCPQFVTRTYTATDDCGNTTVATQRITIEDRTAPTLTFNHPLLVNLVDADTLFVNCDRAPAFGVGDVTATDACSNPVSLSFQDFIVRTGDCNTDGYLFFMYCGWIGTDACGNTDTLTLYIHISDNQGPVLNGVPADRTLSCTASIPSVPNVTATDNCTNNIRVVFHQDTIGTACETHRIVRTWTASDNCGNVTTRTQNITIDVPPLAFNMIPQDVTITCADPIPAAPNLSVASAACFTVDIQFTELLTGDSCGTHKILRKWKATDPCGNMIMVGQTITITVPTLTLNGIPSNVSIPCTSGIPLVPQVTFTPNCNNPQLTFNESIVGTQGCGDYQIVRTWNVIDNCGRSASGSYTISVTFIEPSITSMPADLTITCMDAIPAPVAPTVSAPCSMASLSFNEVHTLDSCQTYKILRKWTLVDNCGFMDMVTQTITVNYIPLTMTGVPADVTVDCQAIPAPAQPVAMGCNNPVITMVETQQAGNCPGNYTIVRTWTATNDCGETAVMSQTITVQDVIAPAIGFTNPFFQGIANGDSIILTCLDVIPVAPTDAFTMDNCDPNPTLTFTEDTQVGSCQNDGYLLRMVCCWKAVDHCGNMKEFCIIIRVEDNEGPVISGVPANMTVSLPNGDTVPSIPITVTATDDCGAAQLSFLESTTALTDTCGYLLQRTWVATDICGNTSTAQQQIRVIDLCDCPNILVTDTQVQAVSCGTANGRIEIEFDVNPALFDIIFIPNLGTVPSGQYNIRENLPAGMYTVVVNHPDFVDCTEKLYINVGNAGCSDTLAITIDGGIDQFCLPSSVLNYSGPITSTSICNAGFASSSLITSVNQACVNFTTAPGVSGTLTDVYCVVHCFNGSFVQCDTTYLIVTVNPLACQLAITDFAYTPVDCQGNGGTATVQITGAIGTPTYVWEGGISNGVTASGLAPGSYRVTVSDQNGCTAWAAATIAAPSGSGLSPNAIVVTNLDCSGTSGSIASATADNYAVYQNGTLLGNTPVNITTAGSYVVIRTNGLCRDSLTVNVTQSGALTINPQDVIVTNAGCTSPLGGITAVNSANTYLIYQGNMLIGATPLQTLSPGDYELRLTQGGCTASLDVSILSAMPVTIDRADVKATNPACAGDNGSIVSLNGSIVFNILQGGILIGTTPQMNLVPGTYTVQLTSATCSDELDYEIEAGFTLGASIVETPESCDGNDGSLEVIVSLPGDYSFAWSGSSSTTNLLSNLTNSNGYAVTVTDNTTGCTLVLDGLEVSLDCTGGPNPTPCPVIFADSVQFSFASDCTNGIQFCLPIEFTAIDSIDLFIDGTPYTGTPQGCGFTERYYYAYTSIPGAGMAGPYRLNSWTVNGQTFTGMFQDIATLTDSMNVWDPTGDWVMYPNWSAIAGGNIASTYSQLSIRQIATGNQAFITLNTQFVPLGTSITLPEGNHTLVALLPSGCSDTLQLEAFCIPGVSYVDSIAISETGLYCFPTSALPGAFASASFNCLSGCANINTPVLTSADTCLLYTGLQVGETLLEMVLCDNNNICDTSYLTIYVSSNNGNRLLPNAINDLDTTQMNIPMLIKVLDNDSINGNLLSMHLVEEPRNGSVLMNQDGTMTYKSLPRFCDGEDQFMYSICNEWGCDSAMVNIHIDCLPMKVYNGFSPNNDGENDFFVIQGIEAHPNNELLIFDRWGVEVFRTKRYKNNWNGRYNTQDLPDGTYFYILFYDSGERMSGYLQINR